MALSYARYYPDGRYFWDERAASLEEQALMPIQDGTEMGMTLDEVTSRLQATDFYAPLFNAPSARPRSRPSASAARSRSSSARW